jgi:hypothetical protein
MALAKRLHFGSAVKCDRRCEFLPSIPSGLGNLAAVVRGAVPLAIAVDATST